jgi:hypothetical protein
MPDGTEIQIEDWHESYASRPEASTVAAYPVCKETHGALYAPKKNEKYRFSFSFESSELARAAFDRLISGDSVLKDYLEVMYKREYADCI